MILRKSQMSFWLSVCQSQIATSQSWEGKPGTDCFLCVLPGGPSGSSPVFALSGTNWPALGLGRPPAPYLTSINSRKFLPHRGASAFQQLSLLGSEFVLCSLIIQGLGFCQPTAFLRKNLPPPFFLKGGGQTFVSLPMMFVY